MKPLILNLVSQEIWYKFYRLLEIIINFFIQPRTISTVVAHFLHTEGVTGSNPVSSIFLNLMKMSEKVAWRLKSQLQKQNLDGAQVAEIPRFLLVRDGGLCFYSCGFNRQRLLDLARGSRIPGTDYFFAILLFFC